MRLAGAQARVPRPSAPRKSQGAFVAQRCGTQCKAFDIHRPTSEVPSYNVLLLKEPMNIKVAKLCITPVLLLAIAGCVTPTLKVSNSLEQPVTILQHGIYSTDNYGGVKYRIVAANSSPKTIKYILFSANGFNAVGDVQADTISLNTTGQMQAVGPLEPGSRKAGTWGPVWYNQNIKCVRLTGVEITYMDGTISQLSTTQLRAALGPLNQCRGNI